jgi:hypothetical protein
MQIGIKTKFLGATNHHGSRIVITSSEGKRLVVPYDYALSDRGNHLHAAGFYLGRVHGAAGGHLSTVAWKDHFHHSVEI